VFLIANKRKFRDFVRDGLALVNHLLEFLLDQFIVFSTVLD
jgi:hypothetical protein